MAKPRLNQPPAPRELSSADLECMRAEVDALGGRNAVHALMQLFPVDGQPRYEVLPDDQEELRDAITRAMVRDMPLRKLQAAYLALGLAGESRG